MNLESRIKDLCDAFSEMSRATGYSSSPALRELHLSENGIYPHNMKSAELRAACVGLASTMLGGSSISGDHILFWTWCEQAFVLDPVNCFGDGSHFRPLMECCTRSAIVNSADQYETMEKVREISPQAYYFARGAFRFTVYTSFPLLEGLLREMCKFYVAADGRVLEPFSVVNRGYKEGERCNSITDLLRLVGDAARTTDLKTDIELILSSLSIQIGEKDGYQVIKEFRNGSLHGEKTSLLVGAIVLQIVCLLLIDRFGVFYDKSFPEILRAWEFYSRGPSPWAMYPPKSHFSL